jgi:1,3-beta-glucan synthase
MKQTKLRRRRVVRYAILYFVLVLLMLALMVAPAVLVKIIPESVFKIKMLQDYKLVQPALDNDDTRGKLQTGTGHPEYSGVLSSSMAAEKAAKETAGAQRMLLI